MDLPAPVSPVRAVRPGAKARFRRSMRTMSRMARPSSIAAGSEGEDATEPGAGMLLRLQMLALQQVVGRLVPVAAGVVVAENGGGGLRLVGDAEGEIAFGEAQQRLGRVRRGLVVLDHPAE